MRWFGEYDSPLGKILLRGEGEALTGLWFEGWRNAPAGEDAFPAREAPPLAAAKRWLDCYFGGKAPAFTLPIAAQGTPFQRAVWEALQKIPFGETTTYGSLAAQIAAGRGARVSAQAVGGAVGRNRLALVIPCHRVLGADGGLTGYAGGLERKARLLALEGARLSQPLCGGLSRLDSRAENLL